MQVALAGSGLWLSDGASNLLPVGPHRARPGGAPLTPQQSEENRRAVVGAWRLKYGQVRRALEGGYYQGWDLHPAELPVRYAATYAFFLEGVDLRRFGLVAAVAAKAADADIVAHDEHDVRPLRGGTGRRA